MVFGPLGFQPGAGDEETHRPTRSRNGEQESEQSCWNASAPKKGRLPLQYHFLWKRKGGVDLSGRCHVQNIRWIAEISMLLLSSTDHIRSSFFESFWSLPPIGNLDSFAICKYKTLCGNATHKNDYNKLFGLFLDRIPSNEAGWLRHTHPSSERTPAFPNPPVRFRLWAQQPQFFTKPAHQHPFAANCDNPLSSHVPPVDT